MGQGGLQNDLHEREVKDMIQPGIAVEMGRIIEKIRHSFPDAYVLTERCVQEKQGEVFFIEENSTKCFREQWDTFIDITTYKLYFSPDISDVSNIQSRLRYVRRWMETQLTWFPFVRNFLYEQEGDTLNVTFELWRRYRLVPPDEAIMRTVTSCTVISNKKQD